MQGPGSTRRVALAGLLSMLCAGATQAAPPSPEMLAIACTGCHGNGGNSAGPSIPNLAGENRLAFIESMQAFRSGTRPSTVMGRLAKGYSDDDIKAMANVYAQERPSPNRQHLDPDLAARGRALHEKHCEACHVAGGRRFEANAPVLAGQWLPYLQLQIADFLSGKRRMSEKMAEQVKQVSQKDLDALAHFYATQE